MNAEKQIYCNDTWESEFHRYDGGTDLLLWQVFGTYSLKEAFTFFGVRKVAKIKKSKLRNSKEIQVQCPYCLNISIQEELTLNHRCPFCYKKSYIDTRAGFSSLFIKKINKVPAGADVRANKAK